MADAEDVLRALGAPPSGVHFIGLVLNRKGFERAVAAGCNEIGMAVVASDTFNRRERRVSPRTNPSLRGSTSRARRNRPASAPR